MKMKTRYAGSKVALACASVLAVAGLTASIAVDHARSSAAAAADIVTPITIIVRKPADGGPPVVQEIVPDSSASNRSISSNSTVIRRVPVTRTRGS